VQYARSGDARRVRRDGGSGIRRHAGRAVRAPFVGGALRPGLVATPAFGGDCFTGSFAVHDAYRCIDGNVLRDPCFADPTRDDAVLWVRDPFSRGVVRLRVSGNLDRSGSAPSSLVGRCGWRTASGALSSPGGATSADSAGRRANYGWSGRQTILWGNPIRRGPTWRIRLSHSFTPSRERLAAIRTAYIGRG